MFGKPNIIVNPQNLSFGKFANLAFSKMNPTEIIDLAEKYTFRGSEASNDEAS